MSNKQPADAVRGMRIDPLLRVREECYPDADATRKVIESLLDTDNQFSEPTTRPSKHTKLSWSNVAGELFIELYANDGEAVDTVFDAYDAQPVPAITPDMVPSIQEDSYELVLSFVSSGYYDSGRDSGPPENCYPPEAGEDREAVRAYLIHYTMDSNSGPITKEEIELSPEKTNELFVHFQYRIQLEEIQH